MDETDRLYERVPDEKGEGFFELRIGDETRRVPAITHTTNAATYAKAFEKDERAKGEPVIVYRAGERGMAFVKPNNVVLLSPRMTSHRLAPRDPLSRHPVMEDLDISPEQAEQGVHIADGGDFTHGDPSYIRITGTKVADGSPFEATVIFQGNPQPQAEKAI